MAYTPWLTAHGEAAPALLRVEAIVPLSPADDSVDTNTVILEGAGTIVSFGPSPHIIMKRIKFVPIVLKAGDPRVPPGGGGGSATIILENSQHLNLLSGQQRSISNVAYGMYVCDGQSHWDEIHFVQQGSFQPSAMSAQPDDQLAALEQRIAHLEGLLASKKSGKKKSVVTEE